MSKTADQLREEANQADRRAHESWERSDTDGFLSQWASGITARKLRLEAQILEDGGAKFPGLFVSETGERVKAKIINGQYGQVWMLLDSEGNKTEFVGRPDCEMGTAPSARTKMGKLGLYEDWEMAPAKAEIAANGTGLSGAATAYVRASRTDGGYPETAVVL